MNRGMIFSYDAILALGIVIVLFSGIMIVSTADQSTSTTQSLLYTKATDETLINFYKGVHSIDAPPVEPDAVNCNSLSDFSDAEFKTPRVVVHCEST